MTKKTVAKAVEDPPDKLTFSTNDFYDYLSYIVAEEEKNKIFTKIKDNFNKYDNAKYKLRNGRQFQTLIKSAASCEDVPFNVAEPLIKWYLLSSKKAELFPDLPHFPNDIVKNDRKWFSLKKIDTFLKSDSLTPVETENVEKFIELYNEERIKYAERLDTFLGSRGDKIGQQNTALIKQLINEYKNPIKEPYEYYIDLKENKCKNITKDIYNNIAVSKKLTYIKLALKNVKY